MERSGKRRARPGGRFPAGSRGAVVCLALALAAGAALTLAAIGSGKDVDPAALAPSLPPATPGAVPVSVQVELHHPGRRVPARFLGLSFEVSSLQQIATFERSGNLVRLLRSLGPGLLRFGGVSADTRTAWTDPTTPRPAWTSSVLEPADMQRLAGLAASSDWRVLLTVGLAHFDPRAAAREVAAAEHALGKWLAAVEIGNEPDAYARHGLRLLPWNPAVYDAEVRHYRRAIHRVAPGVRLAAPGVSGSHSFLRWARPVARAQRPALLTGHHYPLGCHQLPPPSIAGLLDAQTRHLAALSLARFMSVAHRTRIPVRIDETGSVSCGGLAGVSNTFASALWATDYITQAMTAGVSGVNLQGNPANCLGYSPLCGRTPALLGRGTLTPQPAWYALLLTKALIGDRPLPSSIAPVPQAPDVAVRTLRARDGSLHVAVVDEDPPGSAPVALNVLVGRRFRAATVLTLTAPSPQSTSGVTLGGQTVTGDGAWKQPAAVPLAPLRRGTVTATVAPSSAALITVSAKRPGG